MDYTPDQLAAAEKAYEEWCAACPGDSDFYCSLKFVMQTYSKECWQHFFGEPRMMLALNEHGQLGWREYDKRAAN